MATSTALQVIVAPFLGVVFENLGSLIQKEIGVVLGVNKELEKLSITLSTIRDVIEDAEAKQIDDKPIYNWLRKLKDLTYEADDILDECATEALIPGTDNSSGKIQVTSPSNSSCFSFNGIMFRHSIGKRIKELRKKFDEMADQRIKFHLNLIPGNAESRRKEKRETSSFLTEPRVYGREEEKQHIRNLLLKGGAQQDVSVCCIVGMGGLGKTTLAQLVYNDEKIANHFQLRCWVSVSEDFVLKILLKSIIESTGGNARDLEDLDPLQHRVHQILRGKTFLLVLDDVWNEDQTKWYKLKSMLTCGGIGSSIIVTTRLESVASTTSTLPILRLEILSEVNCWYLFKHYAFQKKERYPTMLAEIGKEIVKKCGGVPLAAKALGGLLRYKRDENEWVFVRDSSLWNLPQDKDDAILPALRLSYNHLPSNLKQCFSYCSIFPKDYEIVKDDLIHLWMANGFLQSKGNMELEDIGNEIFNELLWRSLFQDIQKNKFTDMVYCKMHDLVHDLACSITANECTAVKVYNDEIAFQDITRHLSWHYGFPASSSTNIVSSCLSKSPPLLRTFFRTGPDVITQVIQQLPYSNLKCLRVLDLSFTTMESLHHSIGKLKHLRYLDLSFCLEMISLPGSSICSLRNLQVLKLDNCERLHALPKRMSKMTNLRHLGISGCDKLSQMPVGMGNLSLLRTLSMFIVSPKSGCGINELHGLDHLTGELEINGLEHVRNSRDAKNANLMRKKSINRLILSWSRSIEDDEEVASIGESLQPHSNLKQLRIDYYSGLKFPSWMSHSCLPNLVKLHIEGWTKCENLASLGNLPLLESLRIKGMDSLKCIGSEFDGDQHQGLFFPVLKGLYIYEMPKLENLSSLSDTGKLEVFPSLEFLVLSGCPELRTLPRLPSSVKELTLVGERNGMVLERLLENISPNSSRLCTLDISGLHFEFMFRSRWETMLQKLPCLQNMRICAFQDMRLPENLVENLPTLTALTITECLQLDYLPEKEMANLTSLKFFEISFCPKLKSLPELGSRNNTVMTLSIQDCSDLTSVSNCLRHLTTLKRLVIFKCPSLNFLQDDFQDLKSLRELRISILPQVRQMPKGLQQVAGTLETLAIFCCGQLTSLPEWMDKFTSLRTLSIEYCRNLKVVFPEQVPHLTALTISNCHPDLHRRYAKETGDDWHKIAHIPNLTITLGKVVHQQ